MKDIRMMNWHKPEGKHAVCCPQCGAVMDAVDYFSLGDDGHWIVSCPTHGEMSIYKSVRCAA